jgi:hypothetical protein
MKKWVVSLCCLLVFSAGCIPQPAFPAPASPTPTAAEAQDTLARFFMLLNAKHYAEAAALYGGDYEVLRGWNPDVNSSDHVNLWERACEQNGLQCLLVRSSSLMELQGDTHRFQVEFSNPDGSLFVLGPCCGADETEMPPVSLFEYRIARNAEGKFLVMDLPPYVP